MPSALVWDPLEAEPETCCQELGRAGSQQGAAMKLPPTVGSWVLECRLPKRITPSKGPGSWGIDTPPCQWLVENWSVDDLNAR